MCNVFSVHAVDTGCMEIRDIRKGFSFRVAGNCMCMRDVRNNKRAIFGLYVHDSDFCT